jgi:hypothetical protein
MKFNVIGVKRVEGHAKATGAAFDMCRLYCMVPVEPGNGKTKVSGFGFEVAEMELQADALPVFSGMKFPCELELVIEQKFMFGEFRNLVAGVVGVASLKKVG